MNLVEFKKDRYVAINESLHLPKDSNLFKAFNSMMKLQALKGIDQNSKQNYSFNLCISSNHEDMEKVKSLFFDFLKQSEKIVSSSNPREVYQLNFDLIEW